MIIALCRQLLQLKPLLEEKGYTVDLYPGSDRIPDALLYDGRCLSLLEMLQTKDIQYRAENILNSEEQTHNGILLVNTQYNTLEAIDGILKRRLYSPLICEGS